MLKGCDDHRSLFDEETYIKTPLLYPLNHSGKERSPGSLKPITVSKPPLPLVAAGRLCISTLLGESYREECTADRFLIHIKRISDRLIF
jgi:hypothetical protein